LLVALLLFLLSLCLLELGNKGFLSRVIIVYSGHTDIQPLGFTWEATQRTNPLAAALAHDIKKIGDEKNYRRLAFTREAAAALENWHITRHGAPDHPRLTNYSSRRTTHLLKLSMIAAMDHSDAEVIEAHDVQCAQDWLIEAETYMPDVFKAMSSGGDAELTKELHHYIRTHTARTGQGVPSHHIFLWLRSRAPAHSHRDLVDLMLKAGMVRSEISGGVIVYFAKDHDKGD
jgi:hypothetical protein